MHCLTCQTSTLGVILDIILKMVQFPSFKEKESVIFGTCNNYQQVNSVFNILFLYFFFTVEPNISGLWLDISVKTAIYLLHVFSVSYLLFLLFYVFILSLEWVFMFLFCILVKIIPAIAKVSLISFVCLKNFHNRDLCLSNTKSMVSASCFE